MLIKNLIAYKSVSFNSVLITLFPYVFAKNLPKITMKRFASSQNQKYTLERLAWTILIGKVLKENATVGYGTLKCG